MSISYRLYILLFALSGFSGLIYESVWTHYLKLFLGHAAYAQTLVLVIFMGGMALGAWAAGRRSQGIGNLLLAYAAVEALIGLFGLAFHGIFVEVVDLAYETVIPALGSPTQVGLFKWGLAAILILPQSILLGATFPLMSVGILRRFPSRPGHALAILYFANSLGAAIGVLVAGFVLVARVGLPGTIQSAGLINVLLASAVWLLSRHDVPMARAATQATGSTKDSTVTRRYGGLLLCAGLTGCASFLYEIGWIRMLSLVLGSSTHAFELMLSAFILGLALGGLWIRRRIDGLKNVLLALALVQLAMGLLALLTLPLYGQTFELMRYALHALARTDQGYQLFNVYSHGLAMLIMLPATICAGMTLPLLTFYLIDKGHGEASVGGIYAANTLGAIVGVIVAVQVVMPLFGLKSLITLGGAIDLGLGLALLWYARVRFVHRITGAVTAAGALLVIMVDVQLDPHKMSSGVYLYGDIRHDREILFHRDGKTASIDLVRSNGYTAITTNGKTEGAIGDHEPGKDEPTMVLTALLPQAIHPGARNVGVIGLGTGLTTHSLLYNPGLEAVDTIEIESAMVEGARGFGAHVSNVFLDPRSHIHIEDAKAYFTNNDKTYDIILSEPSNPWVSGVAGLFSTEFYRLIRHHVEDDGLFVQWLHLYHIDIRLVASVVKAVSDSFDDYAIYALNKSDIAIISRKRGRVGAPGADLFGIPGARASLARLGIHGPQDLALRKLGDKRSLDPLFRSFDIPVNSDYFPVLDLGSVRTRFLNSTALELPALRRVAAPLVETLAGESPRREALALGENLHLPTGGQARQAGHVLDYVSAEPGADFPAELSPALRRALDVLLNLPEACNPSEPDVLWLPALHTLAEVVLPYLSPPEMATIWSRLETMPCYGRLSDHAHRWARLYRAIGGREFREVIQYARQLLPDGEIRPAKGYDYLVMVAMLSEIALGQPQKAQELWQRYRPPPSLPLELRLLAAVANGQGEHQRAVSLE